MKKVPLRYKVLALLISTVLIYRSLGDIYSHTYLETGGVYYCNWEYGTCLKTVPGHLSYYCHNYHGVL